MSKWQHRDEGKFISKSVLKNKSTQDLKNAKNFIEEFLALRKSEKLCKTYIIGVQNAVKYNGVNKVFVDYRFDGTTTGRLSCAAYTAKESMGVSFHTLPRDTENNIRSIFVAPEGYSFITVDYSAMELRVLAKLAPVHPMLEAFNNKEDLHKRTASLLFNKPVDKISSEERSISKTCSFLVVYGGGSYNLAETFGISIRRADIILESFQNSYPSIFSFMESVHDQIRETSEIKSIFGRRRRLENITSRNKKIRQRCLRQGFNFVIQSAASDLLLCGLLDIQNKLLNSNITARIVATVHDSIELVVKKEDLSILLPMLRDALVGSEYAWDHFGVDFRDFLEIECIVGTNFGCGVEAKFKNNKVLNLSEIYDHLDTQ